MTVSGRVKGRESVVSSLLLLVNVSRIKIKYENSVVMLILIWKCFPENEGLSRRRRRGGGHSKMKGQQKKRGNYWSFLMEMVMKWDMGLGTMGGTGRLSVTV